MSNSIVLANSLLYQQILGSGLASPMQVDPANGDLLKVSGLANIQQCILDLLSTRVGERLMNEDFGSEYQLDLFEDIEALLHVLPTMTIQTITQFEPRVTKVGATATQVGTNAIDVEVTYVVKTTGAKGSLVWPYYLQQPAGANS